MLSDAEFNALEFQAIEDIRYLVGGEIVDVEPIEDGVLCGIVLYLQRNGRLDAIMLDAPGGLNDETTFTVSIAPIEKKLRPLEEIIKRLEAELEEIHERT